MCFFFLFSIKRGLNTCGRFFRTLFITLVLLNPDMHCLCNQCRSRSVGFWRRSQPIWIYTVSYSVCKFLSTIWIKESDWLTTVKQGRQHLSLPICFPAPEKKFVMKRKNLHVFNPFIPCGLFYRNSLDRSISYMMSVWLVFIIIMFCRNFWT